MDTEAFKQRRLVESKAESVFTQIRRWWSYQQYKYFLWLYGAIEWAWPQPALEFPDKSKHNFAAV